MIDTSIFMFTQDGTQNLHITLIENKIYDSIHLSDDDVSERLLSSKGE